MTVHLVVDGSNLMMRGGEPSFAALESAIQSLADQVASTVSVEITTFVDASSRHRISTDERSRFEEAINSGVITQVPAGVQADAFILEFATNNNAIVVSNDRYRDYESQHGWLREQGSGRCFTGLEDRGRGAWIFLERNAGPRPPKKLAEHVNELAASGGGQATSITPPPPPPVSPPKPKPTPTGNSAGGNKIPDGPAGPSGNTGRYRAKVTRAEPHAIVILIDQSLSMKDSWSGGSAKSVEVAEILNKTLRELVLQSTRPEGVRDYFHVAVIGYQGLPDPQLKSLLPGSTLSAPLMPLSEVNKLARIETKTIDDRTIRTPVWVEPHANGSTPMYSALKHASKILKPWVESHSGAFPPVVINISDGRSTEQNDPLEAANELRSLSTSDGNVLLFNCHIGAELSEALRYPSARPDTEEEHVLQMFDMCSVIPEVMRLNGNEMGLAIPVDGRGFLFNASSHDLVSMIDVGTPRISGGHGGAGG